MLNKIEQCGTAWGYVANRLRERKRASLLSTRLIFPEEVVKREERIWLDFLETVTMKEENPEHPPISFQTDKDWLPLFEEQIAAGRANAYLYLQYGVVLYANEEVKEAYQAFADQMS